jgi:hypothetical protein
LFSDYDEVFDEEKGAPEIRHVREEEDDDMDEIEEGILQVDENSATPITADDAEDLEPPIKKQIQIEDKIDDSEVISLD